MEFETIHDEVFVEGLVTMWKKNCFSVLRFRGYVFSRLYVAPELYCYFSSPHVTFDNSGFEVASPYFFYCVLSYPSHSVLSFLASF